MEIRCFFFFCGYRLVLCVLRFFCPSRLSILFVFRMSIYPTFFMSVIGRSYWLLYY